MAEAAVLITVADLLHQFRPLAGAFSLTPSSSLSFPPPSKKPKLDRSIIFSNLPPKVSRTFTPITYSVLLSGTISLPSSGNSSPCGTRCLVFSDSTGSLCCSVLDFDADVIGLDLRVLSWNFIPLDQHHGRRRGYLEIVQWKFSCGLSVNDQFSDDQLLVNAQVSPHLAEEMVSGRTVLGILRAVSPVFMVPCATSLENGSSESVGFLAEIVTSGSNGCSDLNSKFVYFIQPNHNWHPVVSKIVGKGIQVSGLKKKLLHVGGQDSYLMFMTTEKTRVSMCSMPVEGIHSRYVCRDVSSSYHGVVTGIYMQGMVVEMDASVWLVVEDMFLPSQHSLRVGSVVSVQNFHILQANFAWSRIQLLGTSIRTTTDFKSFSLSETRCYLRTGSISLLEKVCGIFSYEELLGSKKKEGLAQICARSMLPADAYNVQDGVFMGFCEENKYNTRGLSTSLPLKLVIPISNFLSICESLWLSRIALLQRDVESEGRDTYGNNFSCEGRSYCSTIRRIISSDELGFVLMGSLKISPSGRLELEDATGSLDIVVPDLVSDTYLNCVYEIKAYKLVLEGLPIQSAGFNFGDPITCRKIFQQFHYKKILKELGIYVHFYLEDSTCLNASFPSPPYMQMSWGAHDELHQLLFVTHKFPALRKLQNNSNFADKTSFFAEALVLPYDIVFLDSLSLGGSNNMLYNRAAVVDTLFRKRTCQFSCLLTFRNSYLKGPTIPGYIFPAGGKPLDFVADKKYLQKIILEFKADCFFKYQLLDIGSFYILKCSRGLFVKKAGCGATLQVNRQTSLWSTSFSFGKFLNSGRTLMSNCTYSSLKVDDKSTSGSAEYDLIFQETQDQKHKILDARLHLSFQAIDSINEETKSIVDDFFSLIKLLKEHDDILSISSCIQTMRAGAVGPSDACDVQLRRLPQGKLVSLTGNIENFHIYSCRSFSYMSTSLITDINEMQFYRICIHVHDDTHMVRVRGDLSQCHYAIGLGAGANATFHRVLMTWGHDLFLIPASLIVINSVKEVSHLHYKRKDWLESSVTIPNDFLDMVSSSLASQSLLSTKNEIVRFRCRVVAIYMLLLQNSTHNSAGSYSYKKMEAPMTKSPLAGFVLDDGSSLCCCWADSSNAEMLLRLQELPSSAFFDSHNYRSFLGGRNNISHSRKPRNDMSCYLEKILRKHRRVFVKNYGLLPDLLSLDLTFSVASDKVLTTAEEEFLKFVVLHACSGPNFDVLCSTGDVKDLQWLDSELLELQSATLSLPNIHLREVKKVNPLKEAKNLFNELS